MGTLHPAVDAILQAMDQHPEDRELQIDLAAIGAIWISFLSWDKYPDFPKLVGRAYVPRPDETAVRELIERLKAIIKNRGEPLLALHQFAEQLLARGELELAIKINRWRPRS